MYCSNCGKEIDEQAIICIYCGVPVRNLAQGVVEPPPIGPRRNNGFAIAGFVLSLLSLYLGLYYCIMPVLALIFSIIAMSRRNKYDGCNGLAIAALAISIVSLVFWIFIFACAFSFVMEMLEGFY